MISGLSRHLLNYPQFKQAYRNLHVIRIGRGPSSSHTDATETAARLAIEKRYLDDHIKKINIQFSGSAVWRSQMVLGLGMVCNGVRLMAF